MQKDHWQNISGSSLMAEKLRVNFTFFFIVYVCFIFLPINHYLNKPEKHIAILFQKQVLNRRISDGYFVTIQLLTQKIYECFKNIYIRFSI